MYLSNALLKSRSGPSDSQQTHLQESVIKSRSGPSDSQQTYLQESVIKSRSGPSDSQQTYLQESAVKSRSGPSDSRQTYLQESVIKSMHVDQSHTPVKGHVRSEFGGLGQHQIIHYAQQRRKKTKKVSAVSLLEHPNCQWRESINMGRGCKQQHRTNLGTPSGKLIPLYLPLKSSKPMMEKM